MIGHTYFLISTLELEYYPAYSNTLSILYAEMPRIKSDKWYIWTRLQDKIRKGQQHGRSQNLTRLPRIQGVSLILAWFASRPELDRGIQHLRINESSGSEEWILMWNKLSVTDRHLEEGVILPEGTFLSLGSWENEYWVLAIQTKDNHQTSAKLKNRCSWATHWEDSWILASYTYQSETEPIRIIECHWLHRSLSQWCRSFLR